MQICVIAFVCLFVDISVSLPFLLNKNVCSGCACEIKMQRIVIRSFGYPAQLQAEALNVSLKMDPISI
ncbi:unnamed protein product [Parnassius apollo]|uniref:(apollo) hypothetical protein n=1 Tax=Parnassius apollo TaxID=110799 RepID=A0A8S3XRR9_PARAO|nr:unnamed protein product [Parnassius apollo]